MINGGTGSSVSSTDKFQELRKRQQKQREALTPWRSPWLSLKYFSIVAVNQSSASIYYLIRRKSFVITIIICLFSLFLLKIFDTPNKRYMDHVWLFFRFSTWWLLLGILSSIGLGSGLHTFVLYLGPHIARFTLKATACGRLNLKSAIYDTAQWHQEPSWVKQDCSFFGQPIYRHHPSIHGGYYSVPLLQIMAAVQLESFLWGLGTAIGELPPYFVSRAARLSGEKVKELQELEEETETGGNTIFNQIRRWIFSGSHSFGFFPLLAFASVPNPLFDLAGLTCGHFLVPFWKFFLATVIGKSLIKTSLQTVFIVTLFNAQTVEVVEIALGRVLSRVPVLHQQVPWIMSVLDDARERFSGISHKAPPSGFSVSMVWNLFVTMMLTLFMVTIVTSTAQGYLIEKHRRELEELKRSIGMRKKDM